MHDCHDSCCAETKSDGKCCSINHGDGCASCSGEHEHMEENLKSKWFLAGTLLFIIGMMLQWNLITAQTWVLLSIFGVSYFLIGKDILLEAISKIGKGDFFDENFLMSIASIGAFLIGEYPEAVAVMLFYQVGEYLQARAVGDSKKSISALMDIRPDCAMIKTDSGLANVQAEAVEVGTTIVVRSGEKVPLDGVILKGNSLMDMRALTGESIPVAVEEGEVVLSGSVNGPGLLELEVTKSFSESTASKIIDLVENASNKKGKTEAFITRFARYYTPAVVGIAVGIAIIPSMIYGMDTFASWLYRALVFLVVSCPCALVISIPLGFFGGVGAASGRGILVKGSSYLELLNCIDTVVFDKTGTLTDGSFHVSEIETLGTHTAEDILRYAAHGEFFSAHPIGISILKKWKEIKGEIQESEIQDLKEQPGFGICYQFHNQSVLIGSYRMMIQNQVQMDYHNERKSSVYVAVDGLLVGIIGIEDHIKNDSKQTIDSLYHLGIDKIHMLTGDRLLEGQRVGNELGISMVHGDLLPHEKLDILEEIIENIGKEQRGKVVFVGDGLNDAPVLARADIGIAMGGVGSDAAIEAADIVIMNDEPSKLITAIQIAKKTKIIVWQNIVGALAVKGIILILGAFGYATMWEAVFADVGVALLAVLNSVRAGRVD